MGKSRSRLTTRRVTPSCSWTRRSAATIAFDGTNFTIGTPAITLGLQGGSLKGQLDVRDGAIQQLRDDIQTTAASSRKP